MHGAQPHGSGFEAKALNELWTNERLNAYTRALLALSAHSFGDAKARIYRQPRKRREARFDTGVSIVQQGVRNAGVRHRSAHWAEDGICGVGPKAESKQPPLPAALLAIDPTNAG
jgi:hypothetical protein